jgi:hypothetical protein
MATARITSHAQLRERIAALQAQRDNYKNLVVNDVKEVYGIVKDPVPMIKRTVRDLAADKSFRFDLLKIGLSFAGNYLSRKGAAGIGRSAIASILIEKALGTGTSSEGGNLAGLIARFFKSKKK